jgi:AcrR family transcriptional regulator
MARSAKKPPRRRGRPSPQEDATDVAASLLQAARGLFAERGFNEVGTREIAGAAGVNPAMIHYYFGDKEGLYKAMLERVFERLFSELDKLATESHPANPIADLLALYAGTLSRDPWIPRLMIREVLSEGAPFREEFIERFAGPASKLIPGLIGGETKAGRLRDDLDQNLTALSLIGMTLFPFLAFPVTKRVFGIRLDDEFRERFVDHTLRLFFEGASPR